MYESPIKLFNTPIQYTSVFEKETDSIVFKAVLGVGVDVDKDELLKALKYDRQQYNKGFEDGVKEFAKLLVDKSDTGLISGSDIPDYVVEMCGKKEEETNVFPENQNNN